MWGPHAQSPLHTAPVGPSQPAGRGRASLGVAAASAGGDATITFTTRGSTVWHTNMLACAPQHPQRSSGSQHRTPRGRATAAQPTRAAARSTCWLVARNGVPAPRDTWPWERTKGLGASNPSSRRLPLEVLASPPRRPRCPRRRLALRLLLLLLLPVPLPLPVVIVVRLDGVVRSGDVMLRDLARGTRRGEVLRRPPLPAPLPRPTLPLALAAMDNAVSACCVPRVGRRRYDAEASP